MGDDRIEEKGRVRNPKHGRAVADINAEIILCDVGEDDPDIGEQAKSGKGAAVVRVIPYIFYVAITEHSIVRVRSVVAVGAIECNGREHFRRY